MYTASELYQKYYAPTVIDGSDIVVPLEEFVAIVWSCALIVDGPARPDDQTPIAENFRPSSRWKDTGGTFTLFGREVRPSAIAIVRKEQSVLAELTYRFEVDIAATHASMAAGKVDETVFVVVSGKNLGDASLAATQMAALGHGIPVATRLVPE